MSNAVKPISLAKLKALPVHPFAELFPFAREEEIDAIARDMAERGFRQERPLIIHDGKLLDGRNRREAVLHVERATGRYEPAYVVEWHGEGGTPLDFVLSENLHRRHLSESQRAMVAANLAQWACGMNQHSPEAANLPTQKQAAKSLSISERALRMANNVRERSQDLEKAVMDGKLSVHSAEALVKLGDRELTDVLSRERKEIIARAKEIKQQNSQVSRAKKMDRLAASTNLKQSAKPGAWPENVVVGYFDVPWKNHVRSEETGHLKSPELHYPTMEDEEIIDLCAGANSPFAEDAIVFFWTTGNRIDLAVDVLRTWGFTFKSSMVWDKQDIGTGRWVRDQHELLLIATRGRDGAVPAPVPGQNVPSVYRERKGEHSCKPEFFARMIDGMFPDLPKVEFFQRRQSLAKGDIRLHKRKSGRWAFWGNESGRVDHG